MRGLLSVVVVLSVLVFISPVVPDSNFTHQDHARFAVQLFKAVIPDDQKNVLVSPLSLQLALYTVWLGAANGTEKQLAEALSLPQDRNMAGSVISKITRRLTKGNASLPLDIATRLFVESSFTIKKTFRDAANDLHLSDAEEMNFKASPQEAVARINSWVEGKTNGRIKELFSTGAITSATLMVLVNALYFKAPWHMQFDPARTRNKLFHTALGITKPVEMMSTDGIFKYAYFKEANCRVLQLPYNSDKWGSMVILLPSKKDGLPELEARLATLNLDSIISKLEEDEDPLYVELPKFKMDAKVDLISALKQLGVTDMTENSADFSRLTSEPLVKVDKVVQSLSIEVTEEGTEGSAATGIEYVNYNIPASFVADHPFIFLVRDDVSKTVIFMGRYTGPES